MVSMKPERLIYFNLPTQFCTVTCTISLVPRFISSLVNHVEKSLGMSLIHRSKLSDGQFQFRFPNCHHHSKLIWECEDVHDHLISSQPKQDIASPKREVAYTIQLRYGLQTENVIVCFEIGKNKQNQILIVFVSGMLALL